MIKVGDKVWFSSYYGGVRKARVLIISESGRYATVLCIDDNPSDMTREFWTPIGQLHEQPPQPRLPVYPEAKAWLARWARR